MGTAFAMMGGALIAQSANSETEVRVTFQGDGIEQYRSA